jgi:CRP/FNR family transcriptional regulator
MGTREIDLNARISVLKQNAFFQELDSETLRSIAVRCTFRAYKKHELIWLEGDASSTLALIRDGYVKIVKYSEGGKDVLLELLGPGEVLGAVVLLEGRPYPASARAMDNTLLLLLSRDDFLDIIRQNPAVATQALIAMGARLRHAHEMMRELATECVEARIANVLLILASKLAQGASSPIMLRVRLTRRDVADMVGSTMETAIRILSKWEKGGIVARERGRTILLDLPALRAIASNEDSSQLFHIAAER